MQPASNKIRRYVFDFSNMILLLFLAWQTNNIWDTLPSRIPVHFNFYGQADRYTEKGLEVLMILLLIPLGITVFLYLLMPTIKIIRKYPKLLNMPNKKVFLSLTLKDQNRLWFLLDEFLAAVALCFNVLSLTISIGIIRYSFNEIKNISVPSIILLLFILLLVFIVYFFWMHKTLKNLTSEA